VGTTLQLAHLEALGGLPAHVEPVAIAFRGEEHATVIELHHFGKVCIELDGGLAARKPRGAEILEPMLRAFHAMEHALAAVGEGDDGVLHSGVECAGDDDVAREVAGKGLRIGGFTDDAGVGGGEAVDAHERVRRADHAGVPVRCAEGASDVRDAHPGWRSLVTRDRENTGIAR